MIDEAVSNCDAAAEQEAAQTAGDGVDVATSAGLQASWLTLRADPSVWTSLVRHADEVEPPVVVEQAAEGSRYSLFDGAETTRTGRRERCTRSSGTAPNMRRATRPRVDALTRMTSASRSSAYNRMPRTTLPGRVSAVASTPAVRIRSATASALARAAAANSLRGIGARASSSKPSTLTTFTVAPVCAASSAAASATHGWSAPAFAATTITRTL